MALTKEQNEYLIELLKVTEGNTTKAREEFGERFGFLINPTTIRKKWKNEGWVAEHGGYRHGLRKDDIRQLHFKHAGDISAMAEETGQVPSGLAKRCYNLGLSIINYSLGRPSFILD